MHFSYAGITCYYAILVWESLAANSDRAKPRASSRSRQPFKGQLNASLAQGGSTKALKNNFFLPWRNLPSDSASADPFYYAIQKGFSLSSPSFFNFFSTTRSAFSAWHFRWSAEMSLKIKILIQKNNLFYNIWYRKKISTNCFRIGPAIQPYSFYRIV